MLTLNDGRNELWQWDTGRKLTVDADCSQVHFSNKVFGRSIDVDVVDGVAIIPDILLQTDKDLTALAFVGTAENGYTKISKVFKVNKRNKPADYVFTPHEQTTLEEIKEKLDYLESIQDPGAIKNAVDEYLANNPIQVEEKDPNVPDWAKQPTKPEYTVQEVGAVATVNGIAPDENGNVQIPVSGGNVALTADQIAALDGMFKVCIYDDTKDISGAYAAFKTAFGISDSGGGEEPDVPDEPDVPVVTTYTISKELVNVTSSNSATSVTEGASYTATLTAADGYTLNGASVTIIMGGVDITSTAYADGVISIASVTGNVEIIASAVQEKVEAVLPENGLIAFFDLRNAENVKVGGGYGYNSTQGSGSLYSWYASNVSGDGYGYQGGAHTLSDAGTTTNKDIGTEYTILVLSRDCAGKGTSVVAINNNASGNLDRWVRPKYINSGGSEGTVSQQVSYPVGSVNGYNAFTVRVNGSVYDYFADSTLVHSFDGSDIEDFAYWHKTAVFQPKPYNEDAWITAVAIYSRAISDTEIVEALAYFETLEVA